MAAKKLISFSLFGNEETYNRGALLNVQLYSEFLPDYTCVFFCGPSVPEPVKRGLLEFGAQVREVNAREDWGATMWRFLVLRDLGPEDRAIFRDCDSRPSLREAAAVRAWETSDLPVHVMRDHPAHHAIILAGMWGIRGDEAAKVAQFVPDPYDIRRSADYHEHIDQGWLETYIGPTVRFAALQHCSFWSRWFGPSEPFPTGRIGNEFVGAAVTADGASRYPEHMDLENLCNSCRCTINCERNE